MKKLYNNFKSFLLHKAVASVPIAEVVFILPEMVYNYIYSAFWVTGKPWFTLGLNGVSFTLLKLGSMYENWLIIIFSLIPLLLKIFCGIMMYKNKKIYALLVSSLYLFDFICGLIQLSNLSSTGVLLQEFIIKDKIFVTLFCLFPLFVSTYFLWVYFNFDATGKNKVFSIRKKEKNDFKIILYLVVLTISFVIVFAYNNSDRNLATDKEIKLLNNCYNYSEKYLYNALPEDKNILEVMQYDIEIALETDVFKKAFSQSKFENRFLKAQDVDGKGFYNATTEKSCYANELIFLKCKILLALDKNDEFISYYQENQSYFGSWTDTFCEYLEINRDNFSNDDIVVIDECMRKVLKSDTSDLNKYFALVNLTKIHKNNVDFEEKIKPELKELKNKYLNDFSADEWIDSTNKLSDVKDRLYMLKK